MYKGSKADESSLNVSGLNRSGLSGVLSQTTNQVIEREIDNYTRILEQEKRKFFRVQEHRNEVYSDYSKKVKELEHLKSKEEKTEMTKKKGEVKILERELNQSITTYNEALAKNNKLKTEIDQLRKEKKNQNQTFRSLLERSTEVIELIKKKKDIVEERSDQIGSVKATLINMRKTNEKDLKAYRAKMSCIKHSYGEFHPNDKHKKKSQEEKPADSSLDSQNLVKLRLRNLINKNKEKVKVIENYKRVMQAIWRSFQDVKQESGIADLAQITNSFVKHEQQSLLIYQYISKLNKETEQLTDSNQALKRQLEMQKQQNEEYVQACNGAPENGEAAKNLQEIIAKKERKISSFSAFLLDIEPAITEVLQAKVAEGKITLDEPVALTNYNVESYLAQIETLINQQYGCQTEKKEEEPVNEREKLVQEEWDEDMIGLNFI